MKKKPILFQEIFLQRNNLIFLQGLISIQDVNFSMDDFKTPKDAFLSLTHKDFHLKITITDTDQKQQDFFFQTSPYGDFSLKLPYFSLCQSPVLLNSYTTYDFQLLVLIESLNLNSLHPLGKIELSAHYYFDRRKRL